MRRLVPGGNDAACTDWGSRTVVAAVGAEGGNDVVRRGWNGSSGWASIARFWGYELRTSFIGTGSSEVIS